MSRRVLVAGVGNVFCADDGFGVAVAERLARRQLPVGVEVHDFGIRGIHLAHQLLEAYDLVVLVDAVHRDGPAGTLYVIRPEPVAADPPGDVPELLMDAHDLAPEAVLALVPVLGGTLGEVVIVGCEPERIDVGIGLSPAVAGAVEEAARLVTDLVTGTAAVPADQPVPATEGGT